MAEEKRLSYVLGMLNLLLPGSRESAETVRFHSWNLDPWAKGAYSHFAPGQVASLLPLIAAPANPPTASALDLPAGPCHSCRMSVPLHRVVFTNGVEFAICAHCLPARVTRGPSTHPTQEVTKRTAGGQP